MWLHVMAVSLIVLASVASETCKERVAAIRNDPNGPPMDMSEPDCEEDGSYKRVQCYNAFIHYCWCVDGEGKEIPGTRVEGIGNKPTCELENCAAKRNYLSRIGGASIPKCEADGSYALVQCNASSGSCWCANWKTGEKIDGYKEPPADSSLDCSMYARQCPEGKEAVTCAADPCSVIKCSKHLAAECMADYCGGCNAKFYVNGAEVDCDCGPVCYMNCMFGNEVDENGCPICQCKPEPSSCLEKRNYMKRSQFLVASIPKCEADGSYALVQCDASSGSCWCANWTTGEKIADTERPPADLPLDCSMYARQCQEGREAVTCAADPCSVIKCSKNPAAECMADYCGGCNAKFYVNGTKVDCECDRPVCDMYCLFGNEVDEYGCAMCQCKPGPSSCLERRKYLTMSRIVGASIPKCEADGSYALVQCNGSSSCWCADWKTGEKIADTERPPAEFPLDCSKYARLCPDGQDMATCSADPCSTTKCSKYPEAECRANYCGGCNANFYVRGVKVECENVDDRPRTCYGRPLLEGWNCRMDRCPDGFFCHVHPADAFAACCRLTDPDLKLRKSEFLLRGNVLLPSSGLYNRIPRESCLIVEVREDVMCDGVHCEIPLLGKTHGPVYVMNNSIQYSLVLDIGKLQKGRSYSVSARANIGWCSARRAHDGDGDDVGEPNEWIRKGDYFTEYANSFRFDGTQQSIVKDLLVSPNELYVCGEKRCFAKAVCVVDQNTGEGDCRCPASPCAPPLTPEWLCASNKQTYASECLMQEADCFSGTIYKVRDGECPRKLESSSVGIKVGVSLGCLVVLIILIAVIMIVYLRRHRQSHKISEKELKLEVEPNIYEGLPIKSKEGLYKDAGEVKVDI